MKLSLKTFKVPKKEFELSLGLYKDYYGNVGNKYHFNICLFKIILSFTIDTTKEI